MKKILITGKGSYIGTNLIKWLESKEEEYYCEELDVKGNSWKTYDFSTFDIVFHVAGIAHVSTDPGLEELYYKVNRDLTVEVAKKAKHDGVHQFIFMSSMIVYGDGTLSNKVITEETIPNPSNFYGRSKLEAEFGINELSDQSFNVAILRPPMIYGKNSRGNYPKLAKLAQIAPIFPNIDNERSMLHINNLMELLYYIIKYNEFGLFFPQNTEYVKTSELVKEISDVHNKVLLLTKLFNPLVSPFINRVTLLNKLFGNLKYSKNLSELKYNYQIVDFKESIKLTELD